MVKKWWKIIFLVAAGLFSMNSFAEYAIHTHVVKFDKGQNAKTFTSALVRGDRDLYVFQAKAGQQLKVVITSLEKNAEFQIYLPGYKILPKDEDGISSISGKILSPAKKETSQNNEASSLTHFNNALPLTGNYLIEVGGTRGNTEYKLDISITN